LIKLEKGLDMGSSVKTKGEWTAVQLEEANQKKGACERNGEQATISATTTAMAAVSTMTTTIATSPLSSNLM
jgi:hypothetical protein